eukprot:scaffold2910_cov59-Phaeocystis_antarctica.AAC.2
MSTLVPLVEDEQRRLEVSTSALIRCCARLAMRRTRASWRRCMPVAAGAARHVVVEMADVFREVVGGRNGPGGRVVGAGVVAVTAKWGRNEGKGDAESVPIKELRFGVGQGGGR